MEEWEEEEEKEDERVRERRDGRVRRVTKYAIAEGSNYSLSACFLSEPSITKCLLLRVHQFGLSEWVNQDVGVAK